MHQGVAPLLLLIFLALCGCALPPSSLPLLSIETGMHTAAVTGIDVDQGERFLVTASLDKSVRVWSPATGELLQTLRLPGGDGHDGRAYTCAISPDGRLIAAAGFSGPDGGEKSVYIFDRTSGQLLRRLGGLPEVIHHLTFSPNGGYLAAALGGRAGIRLWDARGWALAFQDTAYGASAQWADFDRQGRLVTTAADGLVRLYDQSFQPLTAIKPPGGKKPHTAAFSPDGELIAVGFRDTININVLSSHNLLHLYSPDTSTILKGRPYVPDSSAVMDGNPGTLSWSKDGTTLYAGGIFKAGQISTKVPISSWGERGRGVYRELDAGTTNTITGLKAVSNGLAFSSSDASFGVLGSDGSITMAKRPRRSDQRRQLESFLVSADGAIVHFTQGSGSGSPLQFSLHTHHLLLADQQVGSPAVTGPRLTSSRFGVSGWQANRTPKRNSRFIGLDDDEVSQSLAIHPFDQGFILGTSQHLRSYDDAGQLRWKVKTPTAWAVNVAGNGRMVIAALGDGTIRWYRWQDGVELAALFAEMDGLRWVMWTPDGFFDHSPGGEHLVGYQINRGRDSTPEFISVDQMYDHFYRPDIISSRFFADAQVATPQLSVDTVISQGLPPQVSVSVATETTELPVITVQVRLVDGGGGIGRVVYRVNGAVQGEGQDLLPPKAGGAAVYQTSRELQLASGENLIEVSAYSRDNRLESTPARVAVVRQTREPAKPHLQVIAIGIDAYRDHALRLFYPVQDARRLVETLSRHGTDLYDRIEVEYLLDREATKENIFRTFNTVAARVQADDVFVLYIAGHGLNVDGEYFFFPWEMIYTGDEAVQREALSRRELQEMLAMVKARKTVILLDTCNAGAFSDGRARGLSEKAAVYKLVRATGRATIMAASENQAALEGYQGHGVFTWALIEGISGGADREGDNNGETAIDEVAAFVMSEVPRITLKKWRYEQFPMHNLYGNSFPLGLVQ